MRAFSPRLPRRVAAAVALCSVGLLARPARAIEYEVFVDVDTEEELYDLYVADQISESTLLTLNELYRKGIDLNDASRAELYSLPNLTYEEVDAILGYREDVGWITDPADLVRANVVSERKLASIAMFLVRSEPGRKLAATNGFVRYQTAWTQGDQRVPPMALQARVNTLRQLTIGASAVVTRNRIGTPAWDNTRQALNAPGTSTQVVVPKYFAQWDTEKWGVIAGTYRIGFAQRLVFDNSGRYTPNGFYLDDALFWSTDLVRECRESAGELGESPCTAPDGTVSYVTPDWDWRDGNRGFAIGAKHLELPKGWMQLYGFFSHERKDIYQYAVFDKNSCDDPNNNDDELCGAPDVFVRRGDLLSPTSTHTFQTLPNMYDEILGGANATYFFDRRTHLGLTGFGAGVDWRIEGADLDFQEYARTPFGGPFGAFGMDAAWGRGWADVFLEVAGTMTSQPQAIASDDRNSEAGFGTVLRHVATIKDHEVEVVGRYYGQDFNNPYARPVAAADQYQGQRARDEAGGRVRYTARLVDRIDLRSSLDVWVQPFTEGVVELTNSTVNTIGDVTFVDETVTRREGIPPKLLTYVRADVDATDWLRPGLWLQYSDRDLRDFQREGACYGGAGDLDFGDGTAGDVNVGNNSAGPTLDSGNDILDQVLFSDRAIALCSGEQFRVTGRARFQAHKRVSIATQYQHTWESDPRRGGGFGNPEVDTDPAGNSYVPDEDRMRQDMSTWLVINSQPVDNWRLRGRFRYLFEDVSRKASLEESLWFYIDTSYTWRWLVSRIRYDMRGYIDRRDSTAARRPGCLAGGDFCTERAPEHWIRLELEARF